MIPAKDLLDFQALDLQLDKAKKRLVQIQTLLKESAELAAARLVLIKANDQLRKLQVQQKDFELEAETAKARHATLESRLMGGQANQRELPAMEREMQHLKERQAGFEEQTLTVMNQVESARTAAGQAATQVAALEARWKEAQAELFKEKAELEASLALLHEQRTAVAAALPAPALQLYERVRVKKGGLAVARIERGICSGCRISLPTTLIQRVRTGREFVYCSSCGRILFTD